MAIETIGALAGIGKTLIDSMKGLRDLLGSKGDAASDFDAAFARYQERIGMIAVQLEQVETLGRMLPIWLKEHSKFKIWESDPPEDKIKLLDQDLRNFIDDSVRDHFSSVFFEKSFEQLPSVLAILEEVRAKLNELDGSIQSIPFSNLDGWRTHLPIVKVRLHDLRKVAVKLDTHADELRNSLIGELRDAASVCIDENGAARGNG